MDRVDDLLLYIEPDSNGLQAYSHKTRELLILASTEVENTWMHYMRRAGVAIPQGGSFTTKDYIKLHKPLFLSEFEITLKSYTAVPPMRPFLAWDPAAPTKSLSWYNAYNKSKHDRTTNFGEATLQNCLLAVAANIALFCVRFSPHPLFQTTGTLAPLVNQLFGIEIRDCNPASFYVPLISLPLDTRLDLVCWESREYVQAWNTLPFRV